MNQVLNESGIDSELLILFDATEQPFVKEIEAFLKSFPYISEKWLKYGVGPIICLTLPEFISHNQQVNSLNELLKQREKLLNQRAQQIEEKDKRISTLQTAFHLLNKLRELKQKNSLLPGVIQDSDKDWIFFVN